MVTCTERVSKDEGGFGKKKKKNEEKKVKG